MWESIKIAMFFSTGPLLTFTISLLLCLGRYSIPMISALIGFLFHGTWHFKQATMRRCFLLQEAVTNRDFICFVFPWNSAQYFISSRTKKNYELNKTKTTSGTKLRCCNYQSVGCGNYVYDIDESHDCSDLKPTQPKKRRIVVMI